jgi:hypothetical protein
MDYIVMRPSVISRSFAARVQPFVTARRGDLIAGMHREYGQNFYREQWAMQHSGWFIHAGRTEVGQELEDRWNRDARHAAGGPNAVAFHECANNHSRPLRPPQFVHDKMVPREAYKCNKKCDITLHIN